MKRSIVFLVLLSLVLIGSALARESKPKRSSSVCSKGYTSQHNWANSDSEDVTKRGYLLLALTWPGSFCESRKCLTTTKISPDFTIHGLWPNYANQGYPSCCKTEPTQIKGIDVEKMVSSDQELSRAVADEWPDFSENNFIANEFNKHGTCAMDVFDNDPIQYIKTALSLKEKYNFFEALELSNNELENGAERTPSQLHHAFLTKASKTAVILECYRGELSEVHVCVRKNDETGLFEPFHCPRNIISSESTCDKQKEISIPAWIPLSGDDGDEEGGDE